MQFLCKMLTRFVCYSNFPKDFFKMNIKNIDLLELTDNFSNDNLENLLEKISTGSAILFTGAGFSQGATNIKGTTPPRATDLADIIASAGGFDGEHDLKFSANYFLKTQGDLRLIKILKEQFTFKAISQSHIDICSINWKRIYTTNYDNSIELSLRSNNLPGECITLDADPKVYYKKENICVHINGNISSLKDDKIPDSFKLSTASYLSPDSFIESNWFYSFKKDLEKCSAIVFIGYSLYDIDIQKILFQSPEFKEKTFFITHPEESRKTKFELSEFGKVYTIGVDGFAKEITRNMPKRKISDVFWLEAFEEYKIHHDTDIDIKDQLIINFMLHGTLSNNFFDSALAGKQELPYLILRHQITDSIRLLSESNFLIVLSDFGNGKTIFLKELTSYLAINGKSVYTLNDQDANYTNDIDKLSQLNYEVFIIIDNYELCLDVIKYLILINNKNIKTIASTRATNHSRFYDEFISVKVMEINVDILEDVEITQLSQILENTGLWTDKAGLSDEQKFKIIHDDNKSQISHTLLNILNAPQMKTKIELLLKNLFNNQNYKNTVLGICILEILNLPLSFSLISEISMNNTIYLSDLTKNNDFMQLFPSHHSHVISRSGLFARSLLSNHFKGVYVVDQLLKIAFKYHSFRNNGNEEAHIYKSLLRFSFIERVLPDDNKRHMLIRYYEQLKSLIPGLERTPHFWLQYAMARIAFDDFPIAQNYLDTAYAKAYEGYDTSYLDAQQARLWIKLAMEEKDQNKSVGLFEQAHNLLRNLHDDQYKYRQVEAYSDFYEKKYSLLSTKNKGKIISHIKEMVKKLEGLRKGYFTETFRMDFCHQKLSDILNKV